MLPVRHPRWWLVIGWMLIALSILVCLLPGNKLPNTGANDKVAHSLVYALLMLWFAGIYPRSRYVLIAFGLFLMGVAIEWAQGAMHLGRVSDTRDVIANSGGIILGLIIALLGLGGWAQLIDGTPVGEPTSRD